MRPRSLRPPKDSLVRRLALAKVRELRRIGMNYSQIGRRYGRALAIPKPAHERPPPCRITPERLLQHRPPAEGEVDYERAAFIAAIEALGQSLLFYSCHGEVIHATRRLQESLVSADRALSEQIALFAASSCGLARLRAGKDVGVIERMAVQELAGTPPRRLVASYIGLDLFGTGPTILIALESGATNPLDADLMKQRFGLTGAQCRVARMLALGRTNSEIAEELCLSPHTARNHTQKILQRLGISSRAQVASVLLRLHEGA